MPKKTVTKPRAKSKKKIQPMGNKDSWVARMAAHSVLEQFVDFLAFENNLTKCVAIRIKSTWEEIRDGDPRLKEFLGNVFANLQEACFYDFGKDMKNSTLKK